MSLLMPPSQKTVSLFVPAFVNVCSCCPRFHFFPVYYDHQLVDLHNICCVLILQNDGTLLATGSYDGQARIWSSEGAVIY